MQEVWVWVCVLAVFLGTAPQLAAFVQFLLVGVHGVRNHYARCAPVTRRIAVLIPAWNEGLVIANTIEHMMSLDYPRDALRVYVIDDASTDQTPQLARDAALRYPGSVFHLRREKGGQGKAHTLNFGLAHVLDSDWMEAVLITDADVVFSRDALNRMVRHLADPKVGAVTAYIKEGSDPGGFVSRSIAFEYITAQAASRRAQNVMGVMACVAGGAQLHSRENLVAIGGAIDTSTLAEDTYTTFLTELRGRRALFDGNAIVWAEEPDALVSLWKQRLRWARGNLQLTWAFRHAWFRPFSHRGIGGWMFGLIWFSTLLTPILMLAAMTACLALLLLHHGWAWRAFHVLWLINAFVYLFVLLFSCLIDAATAKRAWLEGILFPGLMSLGLMALSLFPDRAYHLVQSFPTLHEAWDWRVLVIVFMYAWVGGCMAAGWGLYRLERAGAPAWLVRPLLAVVGYGPVLCAVSFAAYVAEWRGAERSWDKTVKIGKVRQLE
ncbi:glycosyltransferase family 2 protein [Lysobacter sp. S4-A87]|uniref:glycosyltransferase family 2 protein n=1 Tax=Lysobacter sp. S4-A87 TaxID=2925843 RepID=UPI001F53442C|nr:glycosyltransferase [Lysobacter sp. S4-A87]UNK48170.1 glycosyltransferase family 2 protein [Lysobacter sp. S4-A87]